MSTLSVTNIITANNTTDLTLKTGNTSGPQMLLRANGEFVIQNDTFKFVAGNTDVLSVNSTSVLLVSLSTYANNSDAVSAGLVANTLYKTSNGEIRIVV